MRRELGAARAKRLTQALSLVFGTEAFVVLKDIWGLDREAAEEVALWSCHALIRSAADGPEPVVPQRKTNGGARRTASAARRRKTGTRAATRNA